MIKDEKYVVFKRSDLAGLPFPEHIQAVPDAVVMRRQDVFSPPALDAYANGIQVALTICKALFIEPPEGLQEKADYFHQQAVAAWEADRKIPD